MIAPAEAFLYGKRAGFRVRRAESKAPKRARAENVIFENDMDPHGLLLICMCLEEKGITDGDSVLDSCVPSLQ